MTPPDEETWNAWSPHELARRLGGLPVPWYVVGGWALDLWLGGQRRPHDDLEFAVAPYHAPRVARKLSDLAFFEAKAGSLRRTDAAAPMADDVWQWWGADRTAQCWRVDMMGERGTRDLWSYKRDPSLVVPRSDAVRTDRYGIRYLAPALVLLFKAKHQRPKDEADFDAVVNQLGERDRRNLRGWLRHLHADHPWIARLSD